MHVVNQCEKPWFFYLECEVTGEAFINLAKKIVFSLPSQFFQASKLV